MKKRFAMLIPAMIMCMSMTVSATEAETEAADADVAVFTQADDAAEEKELAAIGTQEEGDYEVEIKNATGKAIKDFVVEIDGEGKGDDLLKEDDTFAADEVRMLYFTPKEADPTEEGYKPPVYDIELTFEDDTKALLHTFPFGDVEKAEIRLEETVGYLVFESLSLKKEQNTLEHEKNLAAAAAGTDTAAAGTDTAADTTVQDAGTDQTYTYDESAGSEDYSYDYSYDYDTADYDASYYEEQSGSADTGSTDTGDSGAGDDGCLDDGLILN